MASSASGQDVSDPAVRLATRAGEMELSCLLGTTQKPYNTSFIDQVSSAKMAGYWRRSFFASLWTSTTSCSINKQKKNLVNIQPSGHSLLNGTKVSKHRDCLGNMPFRFLRGRPRTQFKRQFKNWRFCAMRKSITIN